MEAKRPGSDAYLLAVITTALPERAGYDVVFSDRSKVTDIAEADIRPATAEQKVGSLLKAVPDTVPYLGRLVYRCYFWYCSVVL